MKTVNTVIIQARTGSSRLPNKVMMELGRRPMLVQIVQRVSKAKLVDNVVVATTVKEEDNVIENLCRENKITCYRGSENDVLDRYYNASRIFPSDNIVRVTADCPFIDPKIIDEIIETHINGGYDYTSNTLVETYPDGLDTEVMKTTALELAWRNANMASEREHVTPYIKFKGNFKRYSVERTPSLGEKRWTVDTYKDYEFASKIYEALFEENKMFTTEDILLYISNNTEIERINENIIRNEGYLKSLNEDHQIKYEER